MNSLRPLLAPDAQSQTDHAHQRADMRSNMFVMATLYSDRGSAPVRIRNMSRGGALIESAVVPPEGSRVRLSRGSLSVRGEVVWRRDNRAGIRFDAALEVGNWLPSGIRPSHQQRVDEMIHACRSAPAGSAELTPPPPLARSEAIRELLDLRDTLNLVAEELAGDITIAMAHATGLQKLDVAGQMLDKLAARLAGPAYIPPSTGS